MTTKKPEPKHVEKKHPKPTPSERSPVTAKERIAAQADTLKEAFADMTDHAMREVSRENPAVDLAHRIMEKVGTETAEVGKRLDAPIIIDTQTWRCHVCGTETDLAVCAVDGTKAPGVKLG
jgi:hypothetical protein